MSHFDPDEPSSWPRESLPGEIAFLVLLALIALAACAFLPGCTAAQFDEIDRPTPASPCVPSNQYYCGDGSCCYDSLPLCRKDGDGPYCATDVEEDDNGRGHETPFGAKKPKRGPRVKAQ